MFEHFVQVGGSVFGCYETFSYESTVGKLGGCWLVPILACVFSDQLSHEGLFGLHIPFGLSHHELFLTWPKINLSLFLLLIGVLSQLGKELGNYMEPSYRKGWAAVISASILTHLRVGGEAALFSLCNISAWLAEVSSSMAMSKVVSCFTLLLTFFTMKVPGNLRGRYWLDLRNQSEVSELSGMLFASWINHRPAQIQEHGGIAGSRDTI